jgi:beta-N-acetylglucosaminidase
MGGNILNRKLRTLILVAVISFTSFQFKTTVSAYSGTKNSVDVNKEWSVKFNKTLESDTVNSSNIIVKDASGNSIPVAITLSQDKYTVFISPQTSGYIPGAQYTVNISKGVKDSAGIPLSEAGTLKFTLVNKYSDGTSYLGLPVINSNTFQHMPLLSSQKQGFILNSTAGQNVKYRIFVAQDNPYSDGAFQEITQNYISPVNGVVTANKALDSGTNGQKYKAIIYVRRAGVSTGAHRDMNTDYDNYYIDYFRCVDSSSISNVKYTNYDTSLSYGVNKQLAWESYPNEGPYFSKTASFTNLASANQIKYYMNPSNFLDSYGKYQFLKLSYEDGISVDDLNNFLANKGIFKGHGQDFINAAKANNISVSYLVSHAMLETGLGTSYLSSGQAKYNGKVVYNFFGIGAVDSDPNGEGSKKAYEEGWFTPQLAISGGAQWLSKSYINNANYKQDTIYKMRWNPADPGQHQYATDISWSYNQISNIINMINMAPSLYQTVYFDIPKYAQ